MSFTMDHPHVRRSMICPLCDGPKQMACVWCWSCHNETQTGSDEAREAAEDKLDDVESLLKIHEDQEMEILAGHVSGEAKVMAAQSPRGPRSF